MSTLTYYVTYFTPIGPGAVSLPAPHPIRSVEDLQGLIAEVQRINGADTVVLDWKLINQPPTVDPTLITALATAARQDLTNGRNPEQVLTTLLTALDHTSH